MSVNAMNLMQRLRHLGYRWRAMVCLALGLKDAAASVFDDMLAEFPFDAYAMASQAHLLSQAGRRRDAIALLEQLTARDGGNGHHWFNLGFLLEQERELDRAEAALRRATELSPQLDRAWYGLGLVLIQVRRFDEAVEALKRNTQLQPMSPYGWYQLARVHVDRQQPEEARKIIRHLHGFEPKVAAQLERETGLTVSQSG